LLNLSITLFPSTLTKDIIMNDKESKLDHLLADLAASYARTAPPRDGLDKLKRRMQAETNTLSDADLEWLAAAGRALQVEAKRPKDD
jgi:hypothetical protein